MKPLLHCLTITDLSFHSIESVHQSVEFYEAESLAGVPFLFHKLLECDNRGLEYTNIDHDITLRIPKGAIPEGMKVHFEIGVAMYGPFNFPESVQPVSPIVWLWILEGYDTLNEPFHLILPHYLTGVTREMLHDHEVGFARASNNYCIKGKQRWYEFNPCEIQPLFASSGDKSYGVLESSDCCFYCLEWNTTNKKAMDIGYSLVQIESTNSPPQRSEVHFAAVYALNTCKRV